MERGERDGAKGDQGRERGKRSMATSISILFVSERRSETDRAGCVTRERGSAIEEYSPSGGGKAPISQASASRGASRFAR